MKKAFTLAEVLITLGIIGVVAAMTLPTLIQNNQEKAAVTKLKKIYSLLQQSYMFALNENGEPDEWGISGHDNLEGAENIANILFKHMKKIKKCERNEQEGCGFAEEYYYINGEKADYTNLHNAIVYQVNVDGSSLAIITRSANCSENRGNTPQLKNVCAIVTVDINNTKHPNTYGKDYFMFYLTKYGIIPAGTTEETFHTFNGTNRYSCLSTSAEGGACTAWAIMNENMDYTKCKDLDWKGKTKCK